MPAQNDASLPASIALRRFAWGVLVYFVAVILWGAVVRSTGSGAGCGDRWPLCNGTILQQAASVETLIEFTHRITSGLSLLAVVILLVWTLRTTSRGHMARPAAVAALFLTLMEAVLGALLVELGLTAGSLSPLRPPMLALHLTNTLLLVAALALCAHFLGRSHGVQRDRIALRRPWKNLAAVLLVALVAVTGSLAALGDTLFPAASLAAAFHQDLSTASVWLVRWRWAHPALALLTGGFLLWMLPSARQDKTHRGLASTTLALTVCVLLLGLLDVALLAPVWLQIAHLAAALTLWIALVVLAARTTFPPAGLSD